MLRVQQCSPHSHEANGTQRQPSCTVLLYDEQSIPELLRVLYATGLILRTCQLENNLDSRK